MAINAISAELLMLCRTLQPDAADFLMLGRQWLRLVPEEASALQARHGLRLDDLADARRSDSVYAEPLLERLKFRRIESLDATAYQGAGLVHDLNTPLPAAHHAQYDWVLDGGSLEHVFDFPTAIRNVGSLLRPGGLFITMTPANNWMGHGFYQFSPELFYRVFSEAHGFRARFAALVSHGTPNVFHALRDPAETGHRAQINPPGRMSLLFVAEKTSPQAAITSVQQSDYSARWKDTASQAVSEPPAVRSGGLKALFPSAVRDKISAWRTSRRRLREGARGMTRHASLQAAWSASLGSK